MCTCSPYSTISIPTNSLNSATGCTVTAKRAHILNFAILFFLLPMASASGVNFKVCLADLQLGKFGVVGGTDNHGAPIDVANATGITYPVCVAACGSGQEPFNWSVFSQQFASWLLPWLALISQLPFGANDKLDNLESVLLTVGSPTLAAYSLALTVLNGRWIAKKFRCYTYPNTPQAVRILSSLQQAPLYVNKSYSLLSSLIVLPQNDEYWEELVLWLDYTHTWSISAVASIAWVIVAYVFTVVDSLTGNLATSESINANGQAVGSVWLWLVPVVIGWLQVSPKCDSERLEKAVQRANELAYVASSSGLGHHTPIKASKESDQRAIELNFNHNDDVYRDELCSVPIYNYARLLPWVQAVEDVSGAFSAASLHCYHHESVDKDVPWETKEVVKPHDVNRIGTAAQVDEYCKLEPKKHAGLSGRSKWGPDVFSRMLGASALAILLQWGTTASAVAVSWFTPTKGLGCRSGSYLVYGGLSTFAWLLLVASSILTHTVTILEPQRRFRTREGDKMADEEGLLGSKVEGSEGNDKGHPMHPRFATTFIRILSIYCRRVGKSIAFVNAFWVVICCLFQFSYFFDRCFCNSSVLGLGRKAYNVIQLVPEDLGGMRSAWIGGVALAGATAFIFSAFVYLFID